MLPQQIRKQTVCTVCFLTHWAPSTAGLPAECLQAKSAAIHCEHLAGAPQCLCLRPACNRVHVNPTCLVSAWSDCNHLGAVSGPAEVTGTSLTWLVFFLQMPGLEVWFQRASDVVRKLMYGDVDLGIVGYDMFREIADSDPGLIILHDSLDFGKCHLGLGIPTGGKWADIRSLDDLKAYALLLPSIASVRLATAHVAFAWCAGSDLLREQPTSGLFAGCQSGRRPTLCGL